MTKIQKIKADLPYIRQEIFVGDKFNDYICKKIKNYRYDKFLLVIDINVYNAQKLYIGKIIQKLKINDIIFLKPAPNYKSYSECDKIFKKLVKLNANRKSCIIAIGGGYVSDIAGYAASVYMRGIDFIQISTTVMSMVDPVIGKVAINYGKIKNLLGSFYSPRYTFCDTAFIKTINLTEKVYGLIEAWKHAILVDDKNIIEKIEGYLKDPNDDALEDLLLFSICTKKYFVEIDSRDINGHHKALSLGHTMANYFEKKPFVRHGVAVFYGIIFASVLSFILGDLNEKKYSQILNTAILFEKRVSLIEIFKKEIKFNKITKVLLSDKINSGNKYNFVIPTSKGFEVKKGISKKTIKKAMIIFNKLDLKKV